MRKYKRISLAGIPITWLWIESVVIWFLNSTHHLTKAISFVILWQLEGYSKGWVNSIGWSTEYIFIPKAFSSTARSLYLLSEGQQNKVWQRLDSVQNREVKVSQTGNVVWCQVDNSVTLHSYKKSKPAFCMHLAFRAISWDRDKKRVRSGKQ